MKSLFVITFLLIFVNCGFSYDIGGAFSIDYYNNPIEDSAPSPIQIRPTVFLNIDSGLFNFRTGLGILEGNYEISEGNNETPSGIPVFNDMYGGFYTLELDLFLYPGLSLNMSDSIIVGFAAGGGVRVPLLTKVDDGVSSSEADDAFDWFYSDLHFLFWGAQVYTSIKLPLSDTSRFFCAVEYKDFITREDQWTLGATTGMLWQF